jgi:putative glutamine amidotransferase
MTYRPLVAVVAYHLTGGRVSRWPQGGYGVPGPYIDALRRAGARTAIVSPGEQGDPEELLDPFDGLVLVGGGDVDPARYGAVPDPAHSYGVEPDRDGLEIALLVAADRLQMPVLCICRGMQIMNVAFGGTLSQHLPDVPGLLEHGVPTEDTRSIHDVRLGARSRTWATTKTSVLRCSSHHHQGVEVVGEGLTVTGRSPDGLVEAIERTVDDPESLHWIVGVQWHPEDTAMEDPAQQSFFDAVTHLARLRGTRALAGGRQGRNREYAVVDPDPRWPDMFEAEERRISAALTGLQAQIQHVGSTSVPGLPAKPTIDIQLSLPSLEPRHAYVPALESLGYVHVGDPVEPDHEYFKWESDGDRRFQIHACPVGSEWERRHLLFRDWLRAHPEDRDAYADLKRRLAREHPRDLMAYVDEKTPFIRRIEAAAEATP